MLGQLSQGLALVWVLPPSPLATGYSTLRRSRSPGGGEGGESSGTPGSQVQVQVSRCKCRCTYQPSGEEEVGHCDGHRQLEASRPARGRPEHLGEGSGIVVMLLLGHLVNLVFL